MTTKSSSPIVSTSLPSAPTPTTTPTTPTTPAAVLKQPPRASSSTISRLEHAFQSFTNQIQQLIAHQEASIAAADEDLTGLVIVSSSSSSFQDRQRKTNQLFERCRVVLQRLDEEQSSNQYHHPHHYHDDGLYEPSEKVSTTDADLFEQLPLYHLQLQTLTKHYQEQLEEMKKKDDELTLYIESSCDDDESEMVDQNEDNMDDDGGDVDNYQHGVVVVGDSDDGKFADYGDSSWIKWKEQPYSSGSRVVDWSFVLDGPFSEMDALQFTID